jgi:hypothetical protein
VSPTRRFDGMHWDTEELRRDREHGWFAQNEAKLLEEARRRREAAEKARRSAEADALRLAHWRRCPKCGNDMSPATIEGTEVEKCSVCEGIFFDRGELEHLMVHHEAHRRGFFRKLLGFSEP